MNPPEQQQNNLGAEQKAPAAAIPAQEAAGQNPLNGVQTVTELTNGLSSDAYKEIEANAKKILEKSTNPQPVSAIEQPSVSASQPAELPAAPVAAPVTAEAPQPASMPSPDQSPVPQSIDQPKTPPPGVVEQQPFIQPLPDAAPTVPGAMSSGSTTETGIPQGPNTEPFIKPMIPGMPEGSAQFPQAPVASTEVPVAEVDTQMRELKSESSSDLTPFVNGLKDLSNEQRETADALDVLANVFENKSPEEIRDTIIDFAKYVQSKEKQKAA